MRRFVLILFVLVFSFESGYAQRKKVGLVLSGGGAKGVAHIGVIKVLEEAGIPIDYVAGTSMGAIVGALYAIGYDAHVMDSLVRKQNWMFLLSDKVYRYNLPFSEKEINEKYLVSVPISKKQGIKMPSGFISGQNVYNLFSDLTIGYHDSLDFHTLPIPFACVSSNLVDGKEVILDRGNLPLAMRASMAIPGVFSPIDVNNMVLVDGGISNNFPADIAQKMGADILIGVDVQAELRDARGLESVTGIIDQMTSFLGIQKYEENKKLLDVYIKPNVSPYSAASFSADAIDTLIARGERVARSQWDELIRLKEQIGIAPDSMVKTTIENRFVKEKSIWVNQIIFKGIDERDEKWVRLKTRLKNQSRITTDDIHRAIAQLYGTGAFSHVSFRLVGTSPYDLEFSLKEKTTSSLNVGFRFDTEEMAAILLNTTFSYRNLRGSRFSLTGRLSRNPYVELDYSLGNTFLRMFNISCKYAYNDVDLYYKGEKTDNITYSYYKGDLSVSNIYLKNFKFQLGARYEYFDFNSFLYADPEHVFDVKAEDYFSYYCLAYLDTYDKRYYPDRGLSLRAGYSFYSNKFLKYKHESIFSALDFNFASVIPVTRRVKVLPALYGRILIGDQIPYAYLNYMGGEEPGRYSAQQLAFVGISHVERFDNTVLVSRVQVRYRLGSNHYLSLTGNYAKQEQNFFDILGGTDIWGGGVGYSYNSIVGPIGATFSLSNWTKELGFYFNLGYYF